MSFSTKFLKRFLYYPMLYIIYKAANIAQKPEFGKKEIIWT